VVVRPDVISQRVVISGGQTRARRKACVEAHTIVQEPRMRQQQQKRSHVGLYDSPCLTCSRATWGGHLGVWARADGCRWDKNTCFVVVGGGHLVVLQWLRAKGCPWDEVTCYGVAGGRHLEILQWARANGCPWDKNTCTTAARDTHLAVVQWLRANGCPCDWAECVEVALVGVR
jgi:hypothetical protein